MNKSISIIAPFFNEEDVISETIDEFINILSDSFLSYEIVLINDGSTDRSKEIVEKKIKELNNVKLINNKTNLGIWKSWEVGVRNACYECVCIIDSDLQYQPADILNLYKKHIEGNQFVQGVRVYNAEISKVRKLISKILSLVLKIFFRKELRGLKDVKSGFFVSRKQLLINIFDYFPNYFFGQSFIALYANLLNSHVVQLPVIFAQRLSGKSYLKTFPLKTILRVFSETLSLKLYMRKNDYYLLSANYFCKSINFKNEFSVFERFKLWLYFKTHYLHKWVIGQNLSKYLSAQLKFQYLSKEDIVDYQTRKLKDITWYFYQNSELFKKKLIDSNVHPYDIENLNDIKKIPYLEKNELKLNFSNNLLSSKAENFKTLLISTSGSTGTPLNLYANSEQLKVRWANTFRAWTWTGWSPRKKQARLWHQTIGMSKIQIFKEYFDNLFFKRKFIPAYSINSSNIDKYIKKLIKHRPYLIDGYAESFNFLLNYLKSKNIKSFKLNSIISSAQEMPENLKKYIKNSMGAEVYDKYGAREFSGIAYEAQNHKGHLICDDSYLVELLINGQEVESNQIGEVFITDLNNLVTPMIRYRIGDLATKLEETEVKNNKIKFNTLGEINGRTKAIILCENNTWVPGTFFAHFFKEYYETIQQYQIVQNHINKIELNLIKKPLTTENQIEEMIKELRKTVGNIEININYVEKIEMVRTGKLMGAISNIDTSHLFNSETKEM